MESRPKNSDLRVDGHFFPLLWLFMMSWHTGLAQPTLTVVSAADYVRYPLAPGSIVSIFASNIGNGVSIATNQNALPTTLGGVSATITDAAGKTWPIPLIAVMPSQVNAVLPSGIATGAAAIDLSSSAGTKFTGNVSLTTVAPSLFSADASGSWLAAGQVAIIHADGSRTFMGSVANCTNNLVWNGSTWSGCVPIPIDLGTSTDQVVLELFGTGLRGVASVVSLCPSCGYDPVDVDGLPVLYAGPQGNGGPGSFYGLDQINVVLPHYLAGSGIISLSVTALAGIIDGVGEGADSNVVAVYIK